MLLGFVLILVVLGTSIGLLVYSTFLPFIETLGTIKFYNMAYYGAISSVERAELVTRYKQPGFVGSGGRLGPADFGPASDANNDDLGQLSLGRNRMHWTINARTTVIPGSGKANVPFRFKDVTDDTYNALRYNVLEKVFLGIDNTSDPEQYYQTTSGLTQQLGNDSDDEIDVQLRLNEFIYNDVYGAPAFCNCDQDEDRTIDDVLMTWSIGGEKDGNIYRFNPRERLNVTKNPAEVMDGDTFIRESNFSGAPPALNLTYSTQKNPFNVGPDVPGTSYYTLIAPDEGLSGYTYSQSYATSSVVDNYFQMGLLNRLLTEDNEVYPFLEYKLNFGGKEVADRFYNIEGIGRIQDYEVRIEVFKPTTDDNVAGDFTVVF